MKKALLIKAGLLTAASAVTVGAGIVPATTFAHGPSESGDHSDARRPMQDHRMGGPVGTVTAVTSNDDGTGTITMTLDARPEQSPRPEGGLGERVRERMEQFREEHPDAPQAGDTVTVNYDSATKFVVNGEESSASAITVGTKIRVMRTHFNSDEVAKVITTDIKPLHDMLHRGIMAVVESVDAAANSFKILLPAHGEHEEQVVEVQYTDDATFKSGHDDATENDLSAGDRVHVNGALNVESGAVSIDNVTNVVILQ